MRKQVFWLGKDGKWRYEISDNIDISDPGNKVRFNSSILLKNFNSNGKQEPVKLPELYENKELYEAVPELKNISVRLNPDLPEKANGQYLPHEKIIEIADPADRKTVLHEIQHAINRIVGSKFKGTSIKTQKEKGWFLTEEEAYQMYRDQPGEMEARLVERRVGITHKKLRKTPPWETLERLLREEGIHLPNSKVSNKLY